MEAAHLAPMMILKYSQLVKHGSSPPEPLVHFTPTVPHGADAEHEG
jgi:hypothetical protein